MENKAIIILTGIVLIVVGLLNLFVGFLALFPGFLEAGMSQGQLGDNAQKAWMALLTTQYGLFALGHIAGSAIQIVGGTYLGLLARGHTPLAHAVVVLALVCWSLEVWGWIFKGYLTLFALPGIAAGALCVYLYYRVVKSDAPG